MIPDFLVEMIWKSVLIAGAGLLISVLIRRRAASERVWILRLTLFLLLLLPAISLYGPRIDVEGPAALQQMLPTDTAGFAMDMADRGVPEATPVPGTVGQFALGDGRKAGGSGALAMAVYGLGVGLLLARLVGGLMVLRRWTGAARPIIHPLWSAAFDRAVYRSGVRRPVRMLASGEAPSPLGWGLRRPAILIDPVTIARDEQAESVMAHEMAHVARHDWPALIFSRVVRALFWFNPLVWLLDRQLSVHSEEAADMHAIRQVSPIAYAQALLTNFRFSGARAVPANAMAGAVWAHGNMARRIRAVLDHEGADSPVASRSWPLVAAFVLIVAALSLSSLTILPAHRAVAQPELASAPAVITPDGSNPPAQEPEPPAAVVIKADEIAVPPPVPSKAGMHVQETVAAAARESYANADPAPVAATALRPAPPAALPMVAVRVLPVVPVPPPLPELPSTVRPVPPAPPAPPQVATAEGARLEHVVAMSNLGVTDIYIADLSDAFGRPVAERDAIALKAVRVNGDLVREWRQAGLQDLTPRQAASLIVLNVTGDYVAGIAQSGLGSPTVRQLLQLRALGVTPADLREARQSGDTQSIADLLRLISKARAGLTDEGHARPS